MGGKTKSQVEHLDFYPLYRGGLEVLGGWAFGVENGCTLGGKSGDCSSGTERRRGRVQNNDGSRAI